MQEPALNDRSVDIGGRPFPLGEPDEQTTWLAEFMDDLNALRDLEKLFEVLGVDHEYVELTGPSFNDLHALFRAFVGGEDIGNQSGEPEQRS